MELLPDIEAVLRRQWALRFSLGEPQVCYDTGKSMPRSCRQSDFWRPRWYLYLPRTEPFQEYLGARIALVTEVVAGSGRTIFALHNWKWSSRMRRSRRLSRRRYSRATSISMPRAGFGRARLRFLPFAARWGCRPRRRRRSMAYSSEGA